MVNLTAQTRIVLGKKVKQIRADGFTPAEVYGNNFTNIHLQIKTSKLRKIYKEAGKNTIIELVIDEKQKLPVLIENLIENPVTNEILSLDLKKVSLTEKIRVDVPIHLEGESPAAKEGFMIVHVLSSLEVETLPTTIPHEFKVSITKLERPGDGINVEDITVPQGVKIITPKDAVIVSVTEHDEESFETPTTPETVIEGEAKEAGEAATEEKSE